jgi:hypothetical protein
MGTNPVRSAISERIRLPRVCALNRSGARPDQCAWPQGVQIVSHTIKEESNDHRYGKSGQHP